ncbi:Retrovirus-related Pol polyprotein from transposon TNT 1-94 [Durusdinium trenchii]
MKSIPEPHEFFKVNIHEERTAAYIARSMPFLIFLVTVCLLILGVLRNAVLLLTITAALNVAMWLWVVSMALTCMYGVIQSQEMIDNANEKESERQPTESKVTVRHIVVIPNYKESESILTDTLRSLHEAKERLSALQSKKDFTVVIAMEEREKDAKIKYTKLKEQYEGKFEMMVTFHPKDLEVTHMDGSVEPEVKGKASNLKHAVQEVCKKFDKEESSKKNVLTVIDADVILHPMYFQHISHDIASMEDRGEDPSYTFWQAPQLPWRNFYTCPVVSRVWGYISSLWEFGGVSGLIYGSHHMVFSAYSAPLDLAKNAECWDGDVIAEDHHAFLKAWFYAVFQKTQAAACPWVQVKPVMLPSKSTSVQSDDDYWSSWSERWDQAKRHAQGVAELSYALLAAWDMLTSLPVTSLGPDFLWRLLKVVFKPFMMHIVSTLQAISLLVLTLYWLASGNEIPWCPKQLVLTNLMTQGDTLLCGLAGAWVLAWPVVIPFILLIAANFMMIRVCFILPGNMKKDQESCWEEADGAVKPWESSFLGPFAGSKQFTALCLLLMDVLIFFGPIMAVYGVLVEILAYCNVLVRGNRFEYKTASKSLASGKEVNKSYGSCEGMDSTQETPALQKNTESDDVETGQK